MQCKDLKCGEMEASNFLLRKINSAGVSFHINYGLIPKSTLALKRQQ